MDGHDPLWPIDFWPICVVCLLCGCCVCVLCVCGRCSVEVLWWCSRFSWVCVFKGAPPDPRTPSAGPPKISRFFVLLPSEISHVLLSCGGYVEFWWCFLKAGTLQFARLGSPGVVRAPALQTPPQNSTQGPPREKKERKLWQERMFLDGRTRGMSISQVPHFCNNLPGVALEQGCEEWRIPVSASTSKDAAKDTAQATANILVHLLSHWELHVRRGVSCFGVCQHLHSLPASSLHLPPVSIARTTSSKHHHHGLVRVGGLGHRFTLPLLAPGTLHTRLR